MSQVREFEKSWDWQLWMTTEDICQILTACQPGNGIYGSLRGYVEAHAHTMKKIPVQRIPGEWTARWAGNGSTRVEILIDAGAI